MQEKRRAATLLFVLFSFAVSLHVISGDYYFNGSAKKSSTTSNIPLRMKGKNMEALPGSPVSAAQEEDVKEEGEEEIKALPASIVEDYLNSVNNIRDFNSEFTKDDISFYWHIPRSAGSTLKGIIGECFGLVSACEVGVRDGHGSDTELAIVEQGNVRYVNVDTSNIEGINRARDMGLVTSTVARPEVIVSSYLLNTAQDIYDEEHKGRAFTLLRHPIERAVSMYHFSLQAGLIPEVTLEEYAKGQGIENNWLVRYLTGKMEGELPRESLEQAKTILKRKFLIGFVDDLNESVQRFIKYNNWAFDEDDVSSNRQEQCINMLIEVGSNRNMAGYDLPKKGSQAFSLISWQTQFDIKLYEYAKEIFDSQTKAWGTKERKKADKKKKKLGGG